jgi:hypothetical protein
MSFDTGQLQDAFEATFENHDAVMKSSLARCLNCAKFWPVKELKWRARPAGASDGISAMPLSQTSAVCPRCNYASIISDKADVPVLTPDFPRAVQSYMKKMSYAFD